MRIFLSIITLLFILFPGKDLYPADTLQPGDFSEYSAENLIGFTRHLIDRKEFYRAYLEIRRLQSYYPKFLTPLEYRVTSSYILFNGERYNKLLEYGNPGGDSASDTVHSIFRFDSYMKLGDYNGAGKTLDSVNKANDSRLAEMLFKRRLYLYSMTGRLDKPMEKFEKIDKSVFSSYLELTGIAGKTYSDKKSPAAALLWGLIPGMGYVYSGDRNTGFVALIVVAVNAAISYYAFNSGSQSIGLFVGAIGTFFYTGSILGGYMAAVKNNNLSMGVLDQRLSRDLKLDADLETLYKNYGIGSGGEK